jgi:phenylacetic acid degradation operon negative regulatory protein
MARLTPTALPLSARSLILDLLSTLRRGSMPVRALVEAAGLLGLAEGSVRVALSRLAADGRVERDERGSYRLGAPALAVAEHVASWRRLEERMRPWSGAWVAVLATRAGAASRAQQRRHARALRWLGFGALERGVAVRPDNLAGGIAGVRVELCRLGLAPGAVVCLLEELDEVSEARARGLWDVRALVTGYRRQRLVLESAARRLPSLPEPEAMVESFRLGGAALRALVLDPLLPEPIVAATERTALVEAMRRYDALGRRSWSAFLTRHRVHHRAAPADTRALDPGARGGSS